MSDQIQLRNGTASAWTSANPTLAQGELGYESDTNKFKMGDGATAWTALAYTAAGTIGPTGLTGQGITASASAPGDTTQLWADTSSPVYNPSWAIVYSSVVQPLTNGVNTLLAADSSPHNDGYWSSASPSVMTIPIAGFYQAEATVTFDKNATGVREVQLLKNSGLIVDRTINPVSATVATILHVVGYPTACAAGDTFSLKAFQASGTTLNVLPGSGSFWFTVKRVG